jgi:hypothetical protein
MAISRARMLMLALCCAGLGWGSAASADTLLIEGLEAAARSTDERPRRGMSKDAVEQRFGSPAARVPAVGQPPISRWEYEGFTVYFEYDLVLHSVVTRAPR